MAFNAGDAVITAGGAGIGLVGQPAFAAGGVPLVGTVESDAAGNCIVCWANGSRTTVTADGANSLLLLDVVSANALSYYHKRVRISPGTGLANPPADAKGQGASEGLVIGVLTLSSGPVDIAIVEFSGGDIWPIITTFLDILS
jgi:hypothetical protein